MKRIDFIKNNNFKEVFSVETSRSTSVLEDGAEDWVVYNELWKTYEFVDEYPMPTGITLKTLYKEQEEDIINEIYIYRAERLIFDGKIETEEEFKTLMKMLSL